MERLFDRHLYLQRLQRQAAKRPALLATTVADELADRLATINRSFRRAALITSDASAARQTLEQSGKVTGLDIITPTADENLTLPPESYDAIFHLLDLHVVNDVPGTLIQIRRALVPDGLLLACLFANDTLRELRQSWLEAEERVTGRVTPRVAPLIDVRALGGLLQRADFALPVVDLDRTRVRYASALELMQDIRHLGLSNLMVDRARTPVTRTLLAAAAAAYAVTFADPDQRLPATVELAWATGWAPHESQQKPLAPGSAKVRLADALKPPKN
jgi:SAM-dependent methyltransferase